MRYGIENGPAWIGALNGEPLGIFGVVPVERVGCIWAVFTELTEGHPMTFLRACREPLKQLQSEYDMLVNYVDAANTKVISWLTWLGFRMEKPAPFGIERKPFRRFEWRRNV